MSEEITKSSLTFGEKAVGLTFNVGGDPSVNLIKELCADVIDAIAEMRDNTDNSEKKAQYTLAIRKIQEGQMWAVRALTWQY